MSPNSHKWPNTSTHRLNLVLRVNVFFIGSLHKKSKPVSNLFQHEELKTQFEGKISKPWRIILASSDTEQALWPCIFREDIWKSNKTVQKCSRQRWWAKCYIWVLEKLDFVANWSTKFSHCWTKYSVWILFFWILFCLNTDKNGNRNPRKSPNNPNSCFCSQHMIWLYLPM